MTMTLAVLPNWQDVPADNFAAEFPALGMVGVNLNQTSPTELKNCIIPWNGAPAGTRAWAGQLGQSIYDKGRQVLWSVPFPGAQQVENVNEGIHDDLYLAIAQELLKIAPAGNSPIFVRPPWEFNLRGNPENLFVDRNGTPNASLGKRAWRRIAALFRATSPRFKIVWSPSVERDNVVDPIASWPGLQFVDIIAPDFYMGRTFQHKPGDYNGWFKPAMRALVDFAYLKGKPFGISELGFETDEFLADAQAAIADIKSCGTGVAFVMWWNDYQVIDCRITGGRSPGLAALVRDQLR